MLQLPALRSYCHSRPCRTLLNSLKYSQLAWNPRYIVPGRTQQKTPFPNNPSFVVCVFTDPLSRNGRLLIRLLHSNSCTRYNIMAENMTWFLYYTYISWLVGLHFVYAPVSSASQILGLVYLTTTSHIIEHLTIGLISTELERMWKEASVV
jgi:hypothetical protein